jgi:hypothetical protein
VIPLRSLAACALAVAVVATLPADDKKPPADDGFKPMFNGKNLDGWVNVNCAPGTFFAKGDEVITTGTPTGFLRTEKQYENFVLEMDWMHANTKDVGNSGLFVWGDPLPAVGTGYTRGIEVQVLVNLEYKDKKTGKITATSHGDLFSIWGATCTPDREHPLGWKRCLPSENRAKGGGEWNHYKVTANDGTIKLEVNGKEVSGVSQCNPRKGYLALESEGAECHFKNMKIKELPTTNPKPEECAKVADGHVSMFNGTDLSGWTAEKDAWKVEAEVLKAVGKGALKSDKRVGACELVFDWKDTPKRDGLVRVEIGPEKGRAEVRVREIELSAGWVAGDAGEGVSKGTQAIRPGTWTRTVVTVQGKKVSASVNGQDEVDATIPGLAADGPIVIRATPGVQIMNVFLRERKEKK